MRLLVVGEDRMCFEVDAETLDPKTCSCYDAYAFTDPRRDIERISIGEWQQRRAMARTMTKCPGNSLS